MSDCGLGTDLAVDLACLPLDFRLDGTYQANWRKGEGETISGGGTLFSWLDAIPQQRKANILDAPYLLETVLLGQEPLPVATGWAGDTVDTVIFSDALQLGIRMSLGATVTYVFTPVALPSSGTAAIFATGNSTVSNNYAFLGFNAAGEHSAQSRNPSNVNVTAGTVTAGVKTIASTVFHGTTIDMYADAVALTLAQTWTPPVGHDMLGLFDRVFDSTTGGNPADAVIHEVLISLSIKTGTQVADEHALLAAYHGVTL